MTTDVRRALQEEARRILERLAFVTEPERVVDMLNGVGLIIQAFPTGGTLLTAAGEIKARKPPVAGERCRLAVMGLMKAAGKPLVGPAIAKKLESHHSDSAVKKALAALTRAGELINPEDGTGYRLPGATEGADDGPGLFD